MPRKLPNVLFFGIDSLRGDHMSLYGYRHLTTPHIDEYLKRGAVFTKHVAPSIPTTSGYSSMLSGLDCFGTNCVALRHKGDLAPGARTLAEILAARGYNTSCVGFGEGKASNVGARGFQTYTNYPVAWGSWKDRPSRKAESLNEKAVPELQRLAKNRKPFFLFLRHMYPHAPYLPPSPFDRMFYNGNECDPANTSLDPVYAFKPFGDFHASWFPPGCTDKDYVIAQYDGEVAYMDACITHILEKLKFLGLEEDTLVVFTSDHGETLYDHDCHFDHHGLYDPTLNIPLGFRFPGRVPEGVRYDYYSQHKDLTPTVLDILGVDPKDTAFDGRSLAPLFRGEPRAQESEIYITEATWMRKHGWRTPQWKYIHALEPDFHSKPEIELYDLIADPQENNNVAKQEPELCKMLEARMNAFIRRRERETGRKNPMFTNVNWHGGENGPFKTSKQAYDTMHIGGVGEAIRLQALRDEARKAAGVQVK